jgi:hypothetical protein
MMSLSQFRLNMFQTFALMRDTGVTIEVYHRRKVYKLSIVPTNEKITRKYKPRKDKKIIPNALIESKPCKECDSLLVNGLCMNQQCPSNQKTPLKGLID